MLVAESTLHAGARFNFNRSNQTYDWLTAVDYNIKRSDFKFTLTLDGESNLIKGVSKRWQENAVAGIASEKSLISGLAAITSARYDVSGLDKRRIRSADLSAGLSYRPTAPVEIRPMLKVERIKRSDLDKSRNDQGLGYSLGATVNPIGFSFARASGELSFVSGRLTNIPFNELRGIFNSAARIIDGDSLWLSLGGLEASKKYYGSLSDAENIVKQIKQERRADFGGSLTLPRKFVFRFDGNAQLSRYLYRYNLTDESAPPQRDNYGRGGGYKVIIQRRSWNLLNTVLGYAWNKSSQDYQGLLLDLDSEAGELSFRGTANLSNRDSLEADIVIGVTSYSNPNPESQQQDRDQQTLLINGRYSHVFSRYFTLGIAGGANSFHQIYISGEWSANNGRNDTYILSPYARWQPVEWLRLGQTFDIQANYITYDFDRKVHETRNRIFRRASSQTEFKLNPSSGLTLQQTFLYRFEDYGQLIWNEGWQQAVSWDRKKGGFETKLTYAPDRAFRFSPVFAWETTADYNYTVTLDSLDAEPQEIRYLADEQIKLLFGIELIFHWADARRLRFDISHRIREFKSHPREISDYVTLTLEYLF
jgi:hypothetical protein